MRIKLFCICFFLLAGTVFAQSITETVARTQHYEVHGNSIDALYIAHQMETRYKLYDQIFRFGPVGPARPLKVRIFVNPVQYTNYLKTHIDEVPPGSIYLHHRQEELRELVLCTSSEEIYDTLPYQAYLQFLRAFIPNPPAWIRQGFAEYFYSIDFNDDGELVYEENLDWLVTVKNMENLPSPVEIMAANREDSFQNFTGLAWSLVSFFVNSGRGNYLRSLTESFMMLSGEKTAEENSQEVIKHILLWSSAEDLNIHYLDYLFSRKSFDELIQEGEAYYSERKMDNAKASFLSAMELKPGNHIPFYYMGIISYDMKDHDSAQQYYQKSADFGADAALIFFVMGLNAAAAGKKNEATDFLRKASLSDPGRFKDEAEKIIQDFGE